MSIMRCIENLIEKLTPKVEASDTLKKEYTHEQFHMLIMQLIDSCSLRIIRKGDRMYDLRTAGKTVGGGLKVLLGKQPAPEMYKNLKLRYEFTLLDDGRIRITVFEHMIGLPKERRAFKTFCHRHLKALSEQLGR